MTVDRAADDARKRMLLVVAVLALGSLLFGGAVLLRGDEAQGEAVELADVPSPNRSVAATPPDASYTNPRGADAAPCQSTADAPAPAVTEPLAAPPDVDLGGVTTVTATLRTTCGDVTLELAAQDAPTTVANFVGLAQLDYYRGVPFHRVIHGFMVQSGDPTGTGTGCLDVDCEQQLPGYAIEDELGLATELVEQEGGYPRGTLAMANAGPDTGGSQFFIVEAEPGYPLQPAYAVFGRVIDGMDVVDRIAQGPADGDRAIDPTVILDVEVDGLG